MAILPTAVIAGLGVGATLGLAAGGYAYASLWPASRLFGASLIAPRRPGELALTFDDGPNPACTPALLELLAGHGIQATFFFLGNRAELNRHLVRRVAEAGHLIANHSWSHPSFARSSRRRIREELTRTCGELEQITGSPVRFFRPPFGARRPAVFSIARELDLVPVLWNAMTSDWSDPSAERIAAHLTAKIERLARRGRAASIVLHDGGHLDPVANRAPSLGAAARLVARYKATHRFVRVDEWG